MYNASAIKKAVQAFAGIMQENRELLISLDAQMGDGDLGIYMAAGFAKAAEAVETSDGLPGDLLVTVGNVISEEAPSTLGTLIGRAFLKGGKSIQDKQEFGAEDILTAFEAGVAEIQKRGKAQRGDKTILDALLPATEAMRAAFNQNLSVSEMFNAGYVAACAGLEESKNMMAKFGRPAYFGEKTIGMQDGGATVGMLLFEALWKLTK